MSALYGLRGTARVHRPQILIAAEGSIAGRLHLTLWADAYFFFPFFDAVVASVFAGINSTAIPPTPRLCTTARIRVRGYR